MMKKKLLLTSWVLAILVAPPLMAEPLSLTTSDDVEVRLIEERTTKAGIETLEVALEIRGEKEARFDLTGCGDFLCSFGPHHDGQKSDYLIIQGRYAFYVLNLARNKLVGPVLPGFEGEAADAQSGMLTGLRFVEKDRFLLGYMVDSGPFLFSLRHLSTPAEVPAFRSVSGDLALFVIREKEGDQAKLLHARAKDWEVQSEELGEVSLVWGEDGEPMARQISGWQVFSLKEGGAIGIALESGEQVELPELAWSESDEEVLEQLSSSSIK